MNGLDGKGIMQLDEEGMEKLGVNVGQRIKLRKYIELFKLEENISINKKSSEEEVTNFLKVKLNFSQE